MLGKVIEIYAENTHTDIFTAKKEFLNGEITLEMLLEAYLEYEGIFGYAYPISRLIAEYYEFQ